jgi:hypothetical protein
MYRVLVELLMGIIKIGRLRQTIRTEDLSWMAGVWSYERVLLQSILENRGRDLAVLGIKRLHSLEVVIVVPIGDTLLEDWLSL